MALTPKQARFVAEYRVDLNATQAAIRAGYSEQTAYAQGSRLLKHVEVAAAIDSKQQKLAAKLEIPPERIEAELGRYAFADAPDAMGGCEPRDRLKAMELLGKRHKMFTERVEHSFDSMTDEQLEAKKAEIIARATSTTRPPQ